MKAKKFSVLLLITIWTTTLQLHAQSDLQISKAFEQYGQKKGSLMTELSNEALGNYNFKLFKSLIINNNPQASEFIRQCLEKDEIGAKKVKQVISNGVPTSVYLQLPRKGNLSRLILYNESVNSGHKITLVYIESASDSEDILSFILKKK